MTPDGQPDVGQSSGDQPDGQTAADQSDGQTSDDQADGSQTGDQPAGDQASSDQSDGQPSGDQTGEQASGDQTGSQPSGDQPSGDQADSQASDDQSGDQTGDQPSDGQSADQPAGDQPSGDQSDGQPAGDQSSDQPSDGQSADQPAGDQPSGDQPSGDQSDGQPSGDQTDSHASDQSDGQTSDDQAGSQASGGQADGQAADGQSSGDQTGDQPSGGRADDSQSGGQSADDQSGSHAAGQPTGGTQPDDQSSGSQQASSQASGGAGASTSADPGQPYLFADQYPGDSGAHPPWATLVSTAGFFGAILKAWDGTAYNDGGWFRANWPAVRTAGGTRYGESWFRGAYLFLRFAGSGQAQADAYLKAVDQAGGWDGGDIIPIIDVELGDTANPANLNGKATAQQVIDCATTCANRIRAVTGKRVMLYGRGAMRDLKITDHMGCDVVWNPSYTTQMVTTGLETWPLEDIALWQYCGDNVAARPNLPHTVTGFGKIDISVYIKGAQVPTLQMVRGSLLSP